MKQSNVCSTGVNASDEEISVMANIILVLKVKPAGRWDKLHIYVHIYYGEEFFSSVVGTVCVTIIYSC